jgi:AcrR family transcriptional regulator
MESVAAAAGVSKRTLYKRFPDKPALLLAAIDDLIQSWLHPFQQSQPVAESTEDALLHAARGILDVALTPEALALHRIMVAESARFPELSRILQQAGAHLGIAHVASIVSHLQPTMSPVWAAEQFQRLVVTGPQQRALGLGEPLSEKELDDWARQSVKLFLSGIKESEKKAVLF